jgi:hypothetical protein
MTTNDDAKCLMPDTGCLKGVGFVLTQICRSGAKAQISIFKL